MLVTLDYYRTTFLGEDTTDVLLTKWLTRASDDIIIATRGQFDTISELETWQQDYVSKAVCAQAEFYIQRGGNDPVLYSSFQIGSFQMAGAAAAKGNKGLLSDKAMQYLQLSGLGNRAIGTAICNPYQDNC